MNKCKKCAKGLLLEKRIKSNFISSHTALERKQSGNYGEKNQKRSSLPGRMRADISSSSFKGRANA